MIGMSIAIIVAVSSSPELNAVPTGLAMQTLRRLAAAIPEERPNATVVEKSRHKAQKNEVEDLMVYMHKVQEVIEIGNWEPAFLPELSDRHPADHSGWRKYRSPS